MEHRATPCGAGWAEYPLKWSGHSYVAQQSDRGPARAVSGPASSDCEPIRGPPGEAGISGRVLRLRP